MSNRAFIKSASDDEMSLYLNEISDIDLVPAFLKYCEIQGFPEFDGLDDEYAFARLSQVVLNFMDMYDEVLLGDCAVDWYDYGLYEVKGWKIARHTIDGVAVEIEHHEEHDLDEMLAAIDRKQPEYLRIGEAITGHSFPVGDLKLGDKVLLKSFVGYNWEWHNYEVVGFEEKDGTFSEANVSGVPCVSLCGEGQEGCSVLRITKYLHGNETCIRVDVG